MTQNTRAQCPSEPEPEPEPEPELELEAPQKEQLLTLRARETRGLARSTAALCQPPSEHAGTLRAARSIASIACDDAPRCGAGVVPLLAQLGALWACYRLRQAPHANRLPPGHGQLVTMA